MPQPPTSEADTPLFVAFEGLKRLASGPLSEAALAAKHALDRGGPEPVLVFDAHTGKVVDLDLRGEDAEVAARLSPPAPGRGRPRLGVVSREVTLLPRHWAWLAAQPGGASVTLRRLVEAARKGDDGRTRRDGAYRLMSALAGDLPGFEEASRALFAGDEARLRQCVEPWPGDVGAQVLRMVSASQG